MNLHLERAVNRFYCERFIRVHIKFCNLRAREEVYLSLEVSETE